MLTLLGFFGKEHTMVPFYHTFPCNRLVHLQTKRAGFFLHCATNIKEYSDRLLFTSSASFYIKTARLARKIQRE